MGRSVPGGHAGTQMFSSQPAAECPRRDELRSAKAAPGAAVDIPIQGLRAKTDRVLAVLTVWQIIEPGEAPRLVTAYIKP